MCEEDRKRVEDAILEAVRESGEMLPSEMHQTVKKSGDFAGHAIRDAVSRLYDRGDIAVGGDRRLRVA